tara:strand:- start:649 stop:1725 length:1077 start_codon:yes stop_codon:yes gene_type:complete
MALFSRALARRTLLLGALSLLAPFAHAERPRVVLGDVERGPLIEEIALNGTATAQRRSDVSVSIAGLVAERTADTGERISQGDLLLRLDDELAKLEHDSVRAQAREAESRLAEAQRLLEEGRSARGGRVIASTEVERRSSEVDISGSALARARAEEALQAARLRRHELHAPFDAIVAARRVDAGQWVQPGDAVFTLVDVDDLLLDFQVPQHALHLLGDSARLLVDRPDGEPVPAEIATWLPVADARARTFLLRARPPEAGRMVPGMSVSATLRLVRDEDMLSISRDAINRYPDGRVTVWIAEPTDEDAVFVVREQRITEAGSAEGRVFVADGLDGDERIVTRGNESLQPGAEVVATDE